MTVKRTSEDHVMSKVSSRWSRLMLKALGLLTIGIGGGVAMVFLVLGLIIAFVEIFDPVGQLNGSDPMSGLDSLFYIIGGSFSVGVVLTIAAVIAIVRSRRRWSIDVKES